MLAAVDRHRVSWKLEDRFWCKLVGVVNLKFLVDVVPKSSKEITVAKKVRDTVQLAIASWIKRVAHEMVFSLRVSQFENGHPFLLMWFTGIDHSCKDTRDRACHCIVGQPSPASGDDAHIPFSRGCLLLVCFETQDGHRDGFGEDKSHTVPPSVMAACSLSSSRRNRSGVMMSLVAVVAARLRRFHHRTSRRRDPVGCDSRGVR